MGTINNLITLQIIKILSTPWEKTDAFKLGIIDEKGSRTSTPIKTKEEKNSYDMLYRLVFNLKRIVEKLPIGNKKIATYATALLLLKENFNDIDCKLIEEEITNVASANNIAGLDLGIIQPDDTFSDYDVFNVNNDVYYRNLTPKRKYKRWKPVLAIDNDLKELGVNNRIYKHACSKPKRGIILRNENNSHMRVIKEKKQ